MDDIVKTALKKWPNVPACRGWLALDARGDWYMRDDRVQAAGFFPCIKGSRIQHDKLREFIHRNYACDDDGAWFFQNGPQRVYVELEAAPFVWRVAPQDFSLTSHSGLAATLCSAWFDEAGRLFLDTDIGFGLVHTQDMHEAARAVEAGLWRPEPMPFAAMSQHFGFVPSPQRAWDLSEKR
ncbi:MAG: DUF2946 family protein [Burkholderiaceae bacterium]|nr:DUF2946 family protein [Burkholderiaceae bacterium]